MEACPRFLRTIQIIVFSAALALGAAPALAVHNDGTFEIDGDVLTHNIPGNGIPGSPGPDWQDFFTCTSTGCTPTPAGTAASAAHVSDPAPQSIFTGGGSKDGLNLDQWVERWIRALTRTTSSAFAAVLTDLTTAINLYFGADRWPGM
jgi:hypothetical protein